MQVCIGAQTAVVIVLLTLLYLLYEPVVAFSFDIFTFFGTHPRTNNNVTLAHYPLPTDH